MAIWKKDNGDKIELNDLPATVEHAESMGWQRIKSVATKVVKKAARKKAVK